MSWKGDIQRLFIHYCLLTVCYFYLIKHRMGWHSWNLSNQFSFTQRDIFYSSTIYIHPKSDFVAMKHKKKYPSRNQLEMRMQYYQITQWGDIHYCLLTVCYFYLIKHRMGWHSWNLSNQFSFTQRDIFYSSTIYIHPKSDFVAMKHKKNTLPGINLRNYLWERNITK
jgi:hypothetical protein